MADNMKMRARLKNGVVEVKVIMSHPMETGYRKDDADQLVPAHFVQLVMVTLNDKIVLEAEWGTGISKNPYLTFWLKDAKEGDIVTVAWQDNLGETAKQSIPVTVK